MDITTMYPDLQEPISKMDPPPKPSAASLFQVYLRLKPDLSHSSQQSSRFLTVNQATANDDGSIPAHITVIPPVESRRRAVEKFAFTRVFEEPATQLDVFQDSGIVPVLEGVVGDDTRLGRDGLIAALGMSGSGKSHTILGDPKSQRGITQMTLDLVFRTLGNNVIQPSRDPTLTYAMTIVDSSEAHIQTADSYLDGIYGDYHPNGGFSRAQTPMSMVGRASETPLLPGSFPRTSSVRAEAAVTASVDGSREEGAAKQEVEPETAPYGGIATASASTSNPPSKIARAYAKMKSFALKDGHFDLPTMPRKKAPRPEMFPMQPDVGGIAVAPAPGDQYAILISMYEVHNDRIFDLLSPSAGAQSVLRPNQKDLRKRALLFKATESSADRKVVAGLTKVICGDLKEALTVLETGLMERKVTGTGSNSVSSRSHGFFCIELMRRTRSARKNWHGSTLTIVDLAGSERARNAKTAGATLAEGGKINESLMFLGQCLQMQSDNTRETNKPGLVPFRQCKLTELLFTNFFTSPSQNRLSHNPQKAVMIVTADPLGDFNATSQILRYSSLAREVTVPRVPSVPSTVLAQRPASASSNETSHFPSHHHTTRTPRSGNTSAATTLADVTLAANEEIQSLIEEIELLKVRLAEEEERRRNAEVAWEMTEVRMQELEQEVREECFEDYEARLQSERRRWMNAWGEEGDRADERVDRKLDILGRANAKEGSQYSGDGDRSRVTDLERENANLRETVEELMRERSGRPAAVAAVSSAKSVERVLDLRPTEFSKQQAAEEPPSPSPAPSMSFVSALEDPTEEDDESTAVPLEVPSPSKRASRSSPRKLPVPPTRRSTRLAINPITLNPPRLSSYSFRTSLASAASSDVSRLSAITVMPEQASPFIEDDTEGDKENARPSISSDSPDLGSLKETKAAKQAKLEAQMHGLKLDEEKMAHTPSKLVPVPPATPAMGTAKRGVAKSTGRKVRHLTGRRWDLGNLDDDEGVD